LLGGSGTVPVGVAAPRPRTVAKTGTKATDLILAREDRSPSLLPRQKVKVRVEEAFVDVAVGVEEKTSAGQTERVMM
jgi:hypothetical protein